MNGPTAEQQEVIDTWGAGIAVLAGAGSGKTYTLVQKVRELLVRDPAAKFAAVSFTEKSASDLRAKLTGLTLEILGRPLQGHVVTTIHGLCSSILREFPREAGFDGDETMLSESESSALWYQALDSLFFEELAPEVEAAFTALADRESRDSLYGLLARARDLQANEVFAHLSNAPDLAVLGNYVLERYDRLKRRRGALDFNDLELGADRALKFEHVSADYRKRFSLVMVDEFQDTNPVQARILLRFARENLENLCVVGDPKQSIYRFRDADVTVFEDFCARLPKRVSLTKNFRSVPGVLEFCNEVCEPVFASSEMPYQPLAAGLEADPAFAPVVYQEIETPEDLARAIRAEVVAGVPLSDMALLLRKIRGRPEKWLKALTAAGIPIAVESGGLLWNDPRARELANFLKWWANPANEIAGVAFLRAPWVGVTNREIDGWRKEDPSMILPFLRSQHRLARILLPLRLAPGRVRAGELLLALLELPEIEEELGSTLLALWHRAEEATEEGLDFQRVAARLADACDESRRERAVPPPKNAGQLRVMTVHGSKGLEFPHVIMIDFPEVSERSKPMPLLYWDRERGGYLAGRDEDGERLKKDTLETEWKNLEKKKELAESKRVFYVALTRAQKRLMLFLPTSADPAKQEKVARHREKVPDLTVVDFWRGWIEGALRSRPKLGLDDSPLSGPENRTYEPIRFREVKAPMLSPKRPRHSVSEWNMLARCERNYEWTTIRKVAENDVEDARELIDLEEMRVKDKTPRSKIAQSEVGTRVHKALETQDEEGLRELETLLGKRVFNSSVVIEWMRNSPYMRETSAQRSWKELAFEVPVGEPSAQGAPSTAGERVSFETLIGALDRLVLVSDEHGRSHYSIIDFKVTARPKSPEALLETYENQLNLYAWALGRLVPAARGQTRAFLVHIAGGQVREIEVPVGADRLDEFQSKAAKIVGGKAGVPTPSSMCEVCDHRSRCDVGRAYLENRTSKP